MARESSVSSWQSSTLSRGITHVLNRVSTPGISRGGRPWRLPVLTTPSSRITTNFTIQMTSFLRISVLQGSMNHSATEVEVFHSRDSFTRFSFSRVCVCCSGLLVDAMLTVFCACAWVDNARVRDSTRQ